MTEYDIGAAFDAIEAELISSMIRNMKRHRVEESDNEKQWEMWQAKQLESLEEYKRKNRKKYKGRFTEINESIDQVIRKAYQEGGMEQEIEILKSIKKKYGDNVPNRARRIRDSILSKTPFGSKAKQDYFQVNDKKLDALIHATTSDMTKAESAMLRMADDQYRKIIFKAQVYANSGAGTYEQAVDMATKDFLSAGINCIEYKNGRRVNIKSYARMAIQTADKRAALYADGELRKQLGISTVITKKRMNACPKCLPFVDKILIDDVWSGGKPEDGPYPLLSKAMEAGFLHPSCRDHVSTYIPGITEPPEGSFTKDEVKKVEKAAEQEAKQKYAERQAEKFERLAKYSIDPDNQIRYGIKADTWKNVRFKTGGKGSGQYADSKRPLGKFRAIPQNQVVSVLRKEAEEWIKTLTPKERKAIIKYTYNSGDKAPNRFFERLNAMLRGDLKTESNMLQYADTISGALKKHRLKHDVVCYRSVSVNPLAGKPMGSIVKMKQFISTSVIPGRALKGKCKIVIYAPKGTAGAYIEELSKFPNQRELLLDKDCVYRVISNQGDTIELEVLP